MALLEMKQLSRSFGDFTAVKGLTLDVQEGEVFGLLGPNGAGKTTTIKMLTTLLAPTSGTAHIAGFDVVKQASTVRRIIGYVPQMLSADGTLTGYENLLIFAKLYNLIGKEREPRVRDALHFMGLDDAADKMVRTYSGGMIRRLEIAQSMIHAPRVLFLDEPTVGLDPVARKNVWERIEELRREFGTTVLLTTHYMEEADELCNRIAIMHTGNMVALGTPDEMKASIGGVDVTLDDVFAHYTGAALSPEEIIVKLLEQDAPRSVWVNPALPQENAFQTISDFVRTTLVIAELEVRKLSHDATDLIIRAIQPALWLLIFGQVFTQIRAIPTGNISYIEFLAPGILAQSVLFISIFYGIAIIWERDLGILQKFLVSPSPRGSLVMGKALSAGVRALSQAVIIYVLSFILGVHINWHPIALLGVVLVVFLGAAIFSTFSLIIACVVKTRERFMGIGQVLTMPLFFASNAIYPIAIMPRWLQAIALVNPLTYLVDALRSLMLAGDWDPSHVGLDIGVLTVVMVVMVWLGAKMYPKVAT